MATPNVELQNTTVVLNDGSSIELGDIVDSRVAEGVIWFQTVTRQMVMIPVGVILSVTGQLPEQN
jgi:hypothetical protein